MNCTTLYAEQAPTSELEVVTVNRTLGLVMRIKGSAAFEQAERLDRLLQQLATVGPRRVVFDLAELTEVSSLFLGALVRFRAAVLRRGGDVRLTNLPPQVRLVFELTRLVDLFTMEEVA